MAYRLAINIKYPLFANNITAGTYGRAGIPPRPPSARKPENLCAVWTGETRKVKAGEWFLSGAEIYAFRCRATEDRVAPIARIMRIN